MAPFPIFRPPVFRYFIATSLHEFQIFAVRHGDYIDGETGHQNFLLAEFIVPAKARSARGLAQPGDARGNGHLAGLRSRPVVFVSDRRDILFVGGETVQQVRQGLRVHQAVLDGDIQELLVLRRQTGAGKSEISDGAVQMFAGETIVFLNARDGWPILGLIGRQAAINRIDPESE